MAFSSKKFNIELQPNMGNTWGIIGSSKIVKSTLLKYIYKEHYKKFCSIMFSMNTHADIYKDLDKNIIISDTFYP